MTLNRLYEFAKDFYSKDPGTKNPLYYLKYDEVFRAKEFSPSTILEIGVHIGESTKVLSTVYPNAEIVAVDLNLRSIDFSKFPKVKYMRADQGNKDALEAIIKENFPFGIDLVIDDASHIGALSHITFHAVFPYVKSRGIYIVEDWGTGYWDSWPDGGRFQEYPLNFHDGNIPRRIPSHDFGMVGFVKSLVDLTSEADIKLTQDAPAKHSHRIKSLEFSPAICIAEKA